MLTREEQNALVFGERMNYNIEPIIKDTRGMVAFRRFNKTIISKMNIH